MSDSIELDTARNHATSELVNGLRDTIRVHMLAHGPSDPEVGNIIGAALTTVISELTDAADPLLADVIVVNLRKMGKLHT